MTIGGGDHPRALRGPARLGLALALIGASAVGLRAWPGSAGPGEPVVRLDSDTVAVDAAGARSLVAADHLDQPGGARLLAGTRALDPATARGQLAWLAGGTVPGIGTRWESMARLALLDLHALTLDGGAATAGWSPPWRYVWPRDASFTAAAFARAGHPADAEAVLAFLQRVQSGDGTFQARYLPDGSGVPDRRGVELDGSGWVLWSTGQVADQLPDDAARRALLARLRPLVTRAIAACLRVAAADDGLPPPSLDYWETRETAVTLGTAAPLLAGLQAAVGLATTIGDDALASRAGTAATVLDRQIRVRFGVQGYPRRLGSEGSDAAITFLMPPFHSVSVPLGSAANPDPPTDQGVVTAWQDAQTALLRPAGGLAPGAGWKADGISWTPETALFALTAAATGRADVAARWLDWLDRHRTAQGSLPEKVLADGSPAAVAPLAWTSATVLLALAALAHPDVAVPS